ncbi:carbohydrate ABC transporter permease [Actinoplanes sp. DH11]|uniref:carbohydrate ABC transporter permease n=1 Tax=Actinoplanes sp. DH11 TaxID=2857011 RepID=UPI001E506537|nr:carbohydrate ABC transporter permease [Actinoplanes sp. DH11]
MSRTTRPAVYLAALMLVGLMLGPVIYIIIGGFRTNSQITSEPAALPDPWVFGNYTDVLTGDTFWRQVGNSTFAALVTTVGVVGLGVMASYVLARYRFRGRGAMYALFAAGLMFPMTVAITPLYVLIKNLGLINTLPGVILPQIAFGLPTTIIILVPFLQAIPKEIEEAAAIDRCSRLGFFWRMVLPLSVPGLITTGILAFIASWNSYLLPLFILNDQEGFTLPLGVQAFASEYSVDTAKVLAFTSLSMIPALIFFSLFERRIVGGLTGAVKG